MKNIFKFFSGSFFGIFLTFIIFVSSFEIAFYSDKSFYKEEFEKYGVLSILEHYTSSQMDIEELDYVINETMEYLRGNRDSLDISCQINGESRHFYNQSELSHMADVKLLFVACLFLRTLMLIGLAGLVLLVFSLNKKRDAFSILFLGFIGVFMVLFILSLLLLLFMSSDFTSCFTRFHEIFFPQGNWLFDPYESRMICIMPEGFFLDSAIRIMKAFLLPEILVFLISLTGLKICTKIH